MLHHSFSLCSTPCRRRRLKEPNECSGSVATQDSDRTGSTAALSSLESPLSVSAFPVTTRALFQSSMLFPDTDTTFVSEQPTCLTSGVSFLPERDEATARLAVFREDEDDNTSIDSLEEMVEFSSGHDRIQEAFSTSQNSLELDSSFKPDDSLPKRIDVPNLAPRPEAPIVTTATRTTTTISTKFATTMNTFVSGSSSDIHDKEKFMLGSKQFFSKKANELKQRAKRISSSSENVDKRLSSFWKRKQKKGVETVNEETVHFNDEEYAAFDESCVVSENIFANAEPAFTNHRQPRKCCATKQHRIEQQEVEIEQLKTLVKGLVGLVAQNAPKSNQQLRTSEMKKADSNDEEPTTSSTTVSGTLCLSPSSSNSTINQPLSPSSPRIALPLTTVNEECTRSKNVRIQINGLYGMYSGPHIPSKSCVSQGCVVRMESGELYVGSLNKNDTGSFTFHQPGTLYGCNASPKRRIRKA